MGWGGVGWEEMGKGRGDFMGFGLVSPVGPLFLSLNSLTAKWLPQASHPVPALFFGGEALLLCYSSIFPFLCNFLCCCLVR